MTYPVVGLERLYVQSPIRQYIHQPMVMNWLMRHLSEKPQRILEIGCGQGTGLLLLNKMFPEAEIMGIELDTAMANTATRHVAKYQNIEVQNGSITTADVLTQYYDLIVSFGCVHHIPDWEEVIMDLTHYLRKGGYLFLEEYYEPLIEHPLFRFVGKHPLYRFTHQELLNELRENHLVIVAEKNIYECAGLILCQKPTYKVD